MSVQAMTWALAQQLVTDSTARHVLLCLANYASERGEAAFPSVQTLVNDTGLSERCVRQKLAALVSVGAIRMGNQHIAAAYISRGDRQPVVYDLDMGRGAASAPRSELGPMFHAEPSRGAPDAPRKAGPERGARHAPRTTERGAQPAPRSTERGAPDAPRGVNGVHVVPETGCTTCTQSVNKEIQGGAGARADVPAHAHTRVREAELGELNDFDRQLIAPYLDGLPASIEIPLWVDFVKHRKVRRAGLMSISSYRQLLRDLQQLEADGVDLNDSLRETLSLDLIKPVDPRTNSRRQGARPTANRPRVNDDFDGVQYASTDVSDLPEDLQPETAHAD